VSDLERNQSEILGAKRYATKTKGRRHELDGNVGDEEDGRGNKDDRSDHSREGRPKRHLSLPVSRHATSVAWKFGDWRRSMRRPCLTCRTSGAVLSRVH